MFGVVNFVDFVHSPPVCFIFILVSLTKYYDCDCIHCVRVCLFAFNDRRIEKNWFLLRFYYTHLQPANMSIWRKHTHTCLERQNENCTIHTGYGLCVKCMRLKWTIKFATSSVGRWLASSIELVANTLHLFFLFHFVTHISHTFIPILRRSETYIWLR